MEGIHSRLAKSAQFQAKMQQGGLYLFSGRLNEVIQVVLLNAFSIMNHLLLIIPIQPRGLAFTRHNGLCERVSVKRERALAGATSARRREREDGCRPCDRQRAGCLMRKWMRGDIHWPPPSHPPTLFSTAFRIQLRWAEQALGSHSNHH